MYEIYVVNYGDTLDSIGSKFNISKEVLEKINGNIYNLTPGMQIVVPSSNKTPFLTYVVKKGDNMYDIARKNNVNYNDLLIINGLNPSDYIYPNQEILIPKEGYGLYITKENETLNNVASKLNVSASSIINENGSLYLLPDQLVIYKKEKSI